MDSSLPCINTFVNIVDVQSANHNVVMLIRTKISQECFQFFIEGKLMF